MAKASRDKGAKFRVVHIALEQGFYDIAELCLLVRELPFCAGISAMYGHTMLRFEIPFSSKKAGTCGQNGTR
jgi:hypothetical protein